MTKTAVKLTYDKEQYELYFTRETVRRLEATGFDFQELIDGKRPGTLYYQLFEGAFMARHSKTKRRLITEIYNHISNKTDLIAALIELYAETLNTLIDEASEDGDGKNVTWETI